MKIRRQGSEESSYSRVADVLINAETGQTWTGRNHVKVKTDISTMPGMSQVERVTGIGDIRQSCPHSPQKKPALWTPCHGHPDLEALLSAVQVLHRTLYSHRRRRALSLGLRPHLALLEEEGSQKGFAIFRVPTVSLLFPRCQFLIQLPEVPALPSHGTCLSWQDDSLSPGGGTRCFS